MAWDRAGVGRNFSMRKLGKQPRAYSERVLDHCSRPRNAGSLDKRDPSVGTGLAGTPESGDVIVIQVRVGDGQVIEEAKFKAFGCGSSIASSSLATEWLKGKTLDEALTIRNTEIVSELELPPSKIHCSVLAEDAVRAAIGNYLEKRESESRGKATPVRVASE